jgi:hypothetical protein
MIESAKLYQECLICKGTGLVRHLTNIQIGKPCPACKEIRVIETGINVGQMERAVSFETECKMQSITGKMLIDRIPRKAIDALEKIKIVMRDNPATKERESSFTINCLLATIQDALDQTGI